MAKEIKNWLDEFVEKGADPSDVTNWPDSWSQNGGDDSGTGPSGKGIVNNLWVSNQYAMAKELTQEDVGTEIDVYDKWSNSFTTASVSSIERYTKIYEVPTGDGQTGFAVGQLGFVFFNHLWDTNKMVLHAYYTTDCVNWRELTPLLVDSISNEGLGKFISDNVVYMQDSSYIYNSFFDVNSGASVLVMNTDIDATFEESMPAIFFASLADGIYAGVEDPETSHLVIYKNTNLFNGGTWTKIGDTELEFADSMRYGIGMTYNNTSYYFWVDENNLKVYMTSDFDTILELQYENARFIYNTGAGLGVIWRRGAERDKLTRILDIVNGEPIGEDVKLSQFHAEQNVYYLNNNYWWINPTQHTLSKLTSESGMWTATVVEENIYAGDDYGSNGRVFICYPGSGDFAVIDGTSYNELAIQDGGGRYVYASEFKKYNVAATSGQASVRKQSINVNLAPSEGKEISVEEGFDSIGTAYIAITTPHGVCTITGGQRPYEWEVQSDGEFNITAEWPYDYTPVFKWTDPNHNQREGSGVGFYLKNHVPVNLADCQSGDRIEFVIGGIYFPQADTPTYTIPEFFLEFTTEHAFVFTME